MILRIFKDKFRNTQERTIAALDIGTNRVVCLMAHLTLDGRQKILGVGICNTRGMSGGRITSMDLVLQSVLEAISIAERNSGETASECYVAVSNSLCTSRYVTLELETTGYAIDESDIRKLLSRAVSVVETSHVTSLHALPIHYDVDNMQKVTDPRGMFADRVRAHVHMLIGQGMQLRNIAACIERCHLMSKVFVNELYAAGLACLVDDEKEMGVYLLDIGAGGTSIGCFVGGHLTHIDYVPIGGDHITSDIAQCFSAPIKEAERIKVLHGSALVSPADGRNTVMVSQIGEEKSKSRQVNKSEITAVVRSRVEELYEAVDEKIKKIPLSRCYGKRVAVTGGGALLTGMTELGSLILNKNVRIATPAYVAGLPEDLLTPQLSVALGLVSYVRLTLMSSAKGAFSQANDNRHGFGKVSAWFKEGF